MNPGDEVIYSIEVSGLKTNMDINAAMNRLSSRQVFGSQQLITPAVDESDDIPGEPGAISVPRLFTRWRGDDAELKWSENIRNALGDLGLVTIHAEPWSPAPGYPMNTMEETE